ncbi:MAG: HAD family phosphatase [Muribaculaceae bacterium]|nr:HAD family phosphatase [Muribaculaceae bacterium]
MNAALFDLDGVIIDSEGAYSQFWGSIGREYGCAPTFADDIKGTTLTDILTLHFSDEATREEVTQKIHDYEETMKYPLFDHVTEYLEKLHSEGIKCAVVTSSDDVKMSYLWKQHPKLKGFFDVIVTGSMVKESKPSPEGYLKAAKMLGTAPEDCVVFEDSFQGVEAGRRAGAKVIALATTNPADSLADRADRVIMSFAELLNEEIR